MKKGLIYLLIPLCITFLPSCTDSYTLTLVNSDTEAGTILTEGGEFKVGEQVHIEVELVQGYKVDKWTDSVSGKVGSRSEFNFVMPNRNTELTVYYEYDDFKLYFDYAITADENHYDFSNMKNFGNFRPCGFYVNDEIKSFSEEYYEYTWKDSITIKNLNPHYCDAFSDDYTITDETGTKLGDNEATFEMPNYDKTITFNLVSTAIGALVTTNIPNVSFSLNFSGFNWWDYTFVDSIYNTQMWAPDTRKNGYISYNANSGGYIFDHWQDLDTNETITHEERFDIADLSGSHHYQLVLREA